MFTKKQRYLVLLTVGVLLAVFVFSVAYSQLNRLSFWQETGAWFVAPSGYRIVNGGVQFCEEYYYNDYDEVMGFRWKIKFVTSQGYGSYTYVDALPPQTGVTYEWSPFPYGWVETDGKIGYSAMKYTPVGNYAVWVYAPLESAPSPSYPPTSPTPSPTFMPSPTPTNPFATPTPPTESGKSWFEANKDMLIIFGIVATIAFVAALFVYLTRKK